MSYPSKIFTRAQQEGVSEYQLVSDAIARGNGVSGAATILEVSPLTLRYWLARQGLAVATRAELVRVESRRDYHIPDHNTERIAK